MKRFIITMFAGFIAATPIIAAPILWRDIEVGATETSIREKYPKSKTASHLYDRVVLGKIEVAVGCSGQADIKFAKGLVTRVLLSGGGGKCGDSVLAGLTGKYGKPDVQSSDTGANPERDGDLFVWVADGVVIRFKKKVIESYGLESFKNVWEVRYNPQEAASNL